MLSGKIVALLEVVAKPVGGRLENSEGFGVGLLRCGIGAPRRERNLDVVAALFRRSFDCSAAAQDDQVGQRNQGAGGPGTVEVLLDALEHCQHQREADITLTSHSICGESRTRAPLAPPRLSVSR